MNNKVYSKTFKEERSMTTKEISLKVWEENRIVILANKGETGSRCIKVSFTDAEGDVLDLNGKSVTFYALKPDKTQVFNNCEVSTKDNTATLNITSQILSSVGIVECEFQIFDANSNLLKANGIKIIVSSKGDFLEAVQSTSEYNALIEAMNKASGFSNSIGNLLDLSTENKTSIIGAINEVNGKTIPFSQGGSGSSTPTAIMTRTYLDVMRAYTTFLNLFDGAKPGTLDLTMDYSEFGKIEVYYKTFDGKFSSRALWPHYSNDLVLDVVTFNEYYSKCKLYSANLTFSGKTATFSDTLVTDLTSSGTTLDRQTDYGLRIHRIVGYKY